MITVKMLKNANGAEDGAIVRSYTVDGGTNRDGVYTVSDDLGNAFIQGEDAEEFDGDELKEKKPAKVTAPVGMPTLKVPGK
ncbi:hypothetical protein G6M87_10985 [Rhizobium rhizogenes]|uniref:hypothetical protein n=1 Tax=Rhizobium rhizogenes TaxID=359 RepID=UPI0015738981|nr:hypothetical protein [Rhizobium rhizogenes]NTI22382.1 hypothetical protein [Rhizobium rhizogenes]QTG05968.1 hypothetical protein G6M87_10985 [Rhizobium rhizogenes]